MGRANYACKRAIRKALDAGVDDLTRVEHHDAIRVAQSRESMGDQQGRVGYGMGKAKEVPAAIKKGVDKAKRGLIVIPMSGSTVPHAVMGAFGSGRVMIKPAKEGTGVIAGGPVRAVMESAGIKDVVTKSLGSANPSNIVKATFQGLLQLRSPAEVARNRGISVEDL